MTARPVRLDFELTTACDHRCAHCYNVWNGPPADAAAYPRGQLPTEAHVAMMTKAVRESGAGHVSLTGGEPSLRADFDAIVEAAAGLVPSVQIVTNGSHVPSERARHFAALRVRSVQLTVLSADRARHDARKGAASFDATVRAALDLLAAGVGVTFCFVATRASAGELAGVLELAFALGVRGLSYNRFSPAGFSASDAAALMPTPEQVADDLATAERLAPRWGIRVATAMPIPPCLVRIERFRHVRFGFCSVGSGAPNFVIDPLGNVRSCNLSSKLLGNIISDSWSRITANSWSRDLRATLPPACRGCAYARTCSGGCKEAALATFGRLDHPEPFVHFALTAGEGGRDR